MEEDLEKVGGIARIAATLQEEYKVGVSSGRSLVRGIEEYKPVGGA